MTRNNDSNELDSLETLSSRSRTRLAAAFIGLSACALSACAAAPPAPRAAGAPTSVPVATIEGTWYVVASNLPMWTDGKKVDPVLSYERVVDKSAEMKVHDVLHFVENGKPDTYVGTDTQDPKDEAHFTWHGSGSLWFVSADWYVSKMDASGKWAVISYAKTIGTPAGVDVISRTPELASEELARAKAFVANDFVLSRTGGPLATIPQTASSGVGLAEHPLRSVARE